MTMQIDFEDFEMVYNNHYPNTLSGCALAEIYERHIDGYTGDMSVHDVHDMFTEIEASGTFYEQFERARMPADTVLMSNGKLLIEWHIDPMSDEEADYKLGTLEEFIAEYRSQPHLSVSDEALEFMFTTTKLRNGNVSLATERTLFTDEPAEGRNILKLNNGKTLVQVCRY